jgi:hypothetical protein
MLTTVLPAIIGVSLGRNPSGAVHRIAEDFGPVRRVTPLLIGAVAVEAVVYGLAYNDSISGWWFVIATTAIVLSLPALAKLFQPRREPPVPDEMVGIDREFTADDRAELDRELGLVLTGGGGDAARR